MKEAHRIQKPCHAIVSLSLIHLSLSISFSPFAPLTSLSSLRASPTKSAHQHNQTFHSLPTSPPISNKEDLPTPLPLNHFIRLQLRPCVICQLVREHRAEEHFCQRPPVGLVEADLGGYVSMFGIASESQLARGLYVGGDGFAVVGFVHRGWGLGGG